MKIPIVNEQDEIIEYKEREDKKDSDIIRITAIWITDEDGNILLAQRAFSKKYNPGKWGPAVAGTVEEGETYESNAYKEAKEELGLENVKLKTSEKILYTTDTGKKFCQFYEAQISKERELCIEKDEVAQVKWLPKEELREYLEKKPEDFVGVFIVLKTFFEAKL